MIDLASFVSSTKNETSDKNDNSNAQEYVSNDNNPSQSLKDYVDSYYDVNDYYNTFISRTYYIK